MTQSSPMDCENVGDNFSDFFGFFINVFWPLAIPQFFVPNSKLNFVGRKAPTNLVALPCDLVCPAFKGKWQTYVFYNVLKRFLSFNNHAYVTSERCSRITLKDQRVQKENNNQKKFEQYINYTVFFRFRSKLCIQLFLKQPDFCAI